MSITPDQFRRNFNKGIQEGRLQTRKEVLGFLEEKYMNKDMSTASPKAQAILTLASELSDFLKIDDGQGS